MVYLYEYFLATHLLIRIVKIVINCALLLRKGSISQLYQTRYYNELAIDKTGSMVAQEPSVIIAQRKQTPQNFKHVFESRKNMTAVLFEYHSEQSCRSFLIKTVFVSSIFTFSDHFHYLSHQTHFSETKDFLGVSFAPFLWRNCIPMYTVQISELINFNIYSFF